MAPLGGLHLEDDRRDRVETRGLDGHGISLHTAQGRHIGAPAVRPRLRTSRSPMARAAVVRSALNHFWDIADSVPSVCMSVMILSTAAMKSVVGRAGLVDATPRAAR